MRVKTPALITISPLKIDFSNGLIKIKPLYYLKQFYFSLLEITNRELRN